MNRRHLLSLLTGAGLSSCGTKETEVRREGVFFGIPVHLDFKNLEIDFALKLADQAFDHVRPLEAIFSLWEEGSELSKLNRSGVLGNPSEALLDLLEKARVLYRESDGLFDPTIRSYLLWLKEKYAAGRDPDPTESEERRKLVDFSQVEFSKKEIRMPKGFALDLNAIVQGYATDRVAEFLTEKCKSALVNFGEYRVVDSRAWSVEVGEKSLSIDRALAVSSGVGERLKATGKANHLINPATGLSPEPKEIVAVEADEAWLADGLATILSVGGEVPAAYPRVKVHRL
ncbi:MAG: FAD:protein FMN transferase [Akkermansiaceae bacterium]